MTRFPLPVRTHALPLLATIVAAAPLFAQDATTRIDALRREAVVLRTIDPTDADFSDLEPLAAAIGGARIVVLGEATHSEGATSAVKARLCIFLHQRLGFDVLAWEAGVLACDRLDAALRDERVPLEEAKTRMMRGGWDAIEETQRLFEHARASWRTNRPLRMAGFDGERPPFGSTDLQDAMALLDARLDAFDLDDRDRDRIRAFGDRTHGYISSEPDAVEPEERSAQRALLGSVMEALDEDEAQLLMAPVERGFYRTALQTALISDEGRHRRHHGPREGLGHLRDRQMAVAFRWLANERFPGHRIIIWAATAHLTRNTKTLEPVDRTWNYRDAEHMGDTVFADFGTDLYTIAVTSHHGRTGRVWPEGSNRESHIEDVDLPIPDTFEDLAHRAGSAVTFHDLRGRPEGHWLRGSFVARPLGFIPTSAVWADVVDAFLFIDEMTPDTSLRRPR